MKEYKTILKKTDGGLDIFSYYLGKECLKKKFKSPFRSGDNRPSCHLYLNEPPGEQAYYYLQDFGDSRCSGNAFAIAARVLNMSIRNDFKAVLERIDQDLCLGVFEENKGKYSSKPQFNRAAIKQEISKNKTSSIKTFMPVIQEFMSWELEYWNKYGIDVNTLRRYHVHSLRSVTFNKADGKSFNIFGSKTIPAYGYFFNDMKGIKESKSRVEEYNGNYNVFRLELPLSGTKQEKDISDYFALGRTTQDLQKLINKM